MKKEEELISKVEHLLKKAGARVRLHRFGPKTYKLWQHVFALFIRAECRLSYRRVSNLLLRLGFVVASKSTLQRYAAKLDLVFW